MRGVELLPPAEAVHGNDRWYELRRQGITASEIAIVLGISPYGSPFSLYWQKVNDWRWDGNEYADTGRRLEDAIATWWESNGGEYRDPTLRPAGLYAHPDRPWQLATPDRLVYAEWDQRGWQYPTSLLECKWVAYSWDGWGEPGTDEIPVYYRAQCLWQLDVLGIDEVHVAALGPGGFRAYLVRRDEDDLTVMRKAGEEFARWLAEQDPPDLDSHTATLDTLKRLHPTVGDGSIEIDERLALGYITARQGRKDVEDLLASYEAHLRDVLGSTYHRATWNGRPVVSRSVFEQQRIDSKRLRAEQPDIAAEYTVTTTVDRLNPGRTSHE